MVYSDKKLFESCFGHSKCLPYRIEFNNWFIIELTINQVKNTIEYLMDENSIQDYWCFKLYNSDYLRFFFKNKQDMILFKMCT